MGLKRSYAKAHFLKPDRGPGSKQGQIRERDMKVFLCLVDVAHSSAMDCTEIVKKKAHC